jgi:integrase
MTENHSTSSTVPTKSAKPSPAFPLYQHRSGQWAKKIRGTTLYFGKDRDAALTKYLDERDDLHAGRRPRPDPDAVTIKEVANAFLAAKQDKVDAGELSPRTWNDYKQATDQLVEHLGKGRLASDLRSDDFASLRRKLAARFGPHQLAKRVQSIRSVFKLAYEDGLLDRPMRFGPGFNRPTAKTIRLHRASKGSKLFDAEEIRTLLDNAGQPVQAMILLGINAGFGNADCGKLPLSALDLERGWATFPRPKTGIARRCPLWPETVVAIREALGQRPAHKNPADAALVFVTKYGQGWAEHPSAVTHEFAKLLDSTGIESRSRNFYALRHTFRTIADEAKDQPACDMVMGHESAHMSTHYRERIDDSRLQAVADYVRRWLFPATDTKDNKS